MQFISAYLLAAAAVESGEYSDDYEVIDDTEFIEYMEIGDQGIVGNYVDLSVPTGGSGGGTGENFSGNKFCDDWYAAFVRPIEYMQIYGERFAQPSIYPNVNKPEQWEGFVTTQGGEEQLVPVYLDNLVYQNTYKHINMWFASISIPPWDNVYLGITGVYIPRSVAFKLTGNYPTQGYATFAMNDNRGNIYIPNFSSNYNWISKQYSGAWGVSGAMNRKYNYILVYNVNAFKSYLQTCDRSFFQSLSAALFALAECNINKDWRRE